MVKNKIDCFYLLFFLLKFFKYPPPENICNFYDECAIIYHKGNTNEEIF